MMFLDYLYTLPNSTEGLDAIAIQVSTAVPAFLPLLMAFVFFTIFLGGIARQKARQATADYPMWAVVASMSTFLVTLILTMSNFGGATTKSGLGSWLVIIIVITIFSGVWLFLDRKVSEI